MYYRRKVLLALLEVFGGRLGKTDCEKLLFLFCHTTQRNYYDFFPYQFGGFSLVSYYDKNVLANNGFLNDEDDFVLATEESFLAKLKPEDKKALGILVNQTLERGDALIKKIYLEYPYFALKSKIATRLLDTEEKKWVSTFWNLDNRPCLFTIGYEGLTIDAFLNKLIANNIHALVDVRNNPFSMKYGFSRPGFQNYVERAGIKYYHIPELGIPSELRKDLGTQESYTRLFTYYENNILPSNLVYLGRIKQIITEYSRIALTCFEADYQSCHRHKITDYMITHLGFNIKISHLN
ncbi:MAG: DUF488 domain-containing protein [Candidatus Paceibacterota bacterium]